MLSIIAEALRLARSDNVDNLEDTLRDSLKESGQIAADVVRIGMMPNTKQFCFTMIITIHSGKCALALSQLGSASAASDVWCGEASTHKAAS